MLARYGYSYFSSVYESPIGPFTAYDPSKRFFAMAELSDIQLAETEKRLAIDRMVRAIVRDVHDRILDDF